MPPIGIGLEGRRERVLDTARRFDNEAAINSAPIPLMATSVAPWRKCEEGIEVVGILPCARAC